MLWLRTPGWLSTLIVIACLQKGMHRSLRGMNPPGPLQWSSTHTTRPPRVPAVLDSYFFPLAEVCCGVRLTLCFMVPCVPQPADIVTSMVRCVEYFIHSLADVSSIWSSLRRHHVEMFPRRTFTVAGACRARRHFVDSSAILQVDRHEVVRELSMKSTFSLFGTQCEVCFESSVAQW